MDGSDSASDQVEILHTCIAVLTGLSLRLLQTFVGLLLPKIFFLDNFNVNYLNLHFPKKFT